MLEKLKVLQCMSVYLKYEYMRVIGSVCHHCMKGLRLAHCSLYYKLFASFSENVISCRQRCIEDLWQLQKKDKKSLICLGLEEKLKKGSFWTWTTTLLQAVCIFLWECHQLPAKMHRRSLTTLKEGQEESLICRGLEEKLKKGFFLSWTTPARWTDSIPEISKDNRLPASAISDNHNIL